MICPRRFCGGHIEFAVVDGKHVEYCPRCDRLYAGICRDCPNRVAGQTGKAIRCASCKKIRRRENEHCWMNDPANRSRRNLLARKRCPKRSAERKAERARYSREWRKAHPDRVKKWKRNYLLKQPKAYLAYHRRRNADPVHRAANGALALAKYYQLHPVRPDPHCSGCGVKIEWTPRHGRPRLTCDKCCTPAELRRRQSGRNLVRNRAA